MIQEKKISSDGTKQPLEKKYRIILSGNGKRYLFSKVHIKSSLHTDTEKLLQTLITPVTQLRHPVFFGQKRVRSHYFGIFLRSFI